MNTTIGEVNGGPIAGVIGNPDGPDPGMTVMAGKTTTIMTRTRATSGRQIPGQPHGGRSKASEEIGATAAGENLDGAEIVVEPTKFPRRMVELIFGENPIGRTDIVKSHQSGPDGGASPTAITVIKARVPATRAGGLVEGDPLRNSPFPVSRVRTPRMSGLRPGHTSDK